MARDRIDEVFKIAERYFATLQECPEKPLLLLVRLLSLPVIVDFRGYDSTRHLPLLAACVSVRRPEYAQTLAALIAGNPRSLHFERSPSLPEIENAVQFRVLASLDAVRPYFAEGRFLESSYQRDTALPAISEDLRRARAVAFRVLDEPYNALARSLLGPNS